MKIIFKIILALLFSTALFAAAEDVNFNKENFLKAQADGKIVVVKSYNKYCFTCIKQSTVFKEAKKDFNNIVFMSFKQSDKDIFYYPIYGRDIEHKYYFERTEEQKAEAEVVFSD